MYTAKNNCKIKIKLGLHDISIKLRFQETASCFKDYITDHAASDYDIAVSDERFQEARSLLPKRYSDSDTESRALIGLASKYMLRHDSCLFHAVSFIFRNKAWLITAPSGTGKSTQYFNWQKLFPGEITMISGDMPMLELKESKKLYVWPSPWNGKEGIRSHLSAPLGGVIYLEQGKDNCIRPFSTEEALIPLLNQFMVLCDTEEEIKALLSLIRGTFTSVPVWKFQNKGDHESTRILRETILESLCPGN